MSLYRWSLPGRGQARGKSLDVDSEIQEKFSTFHIGQSKLHRRANISTVFSSLFEREENSRSTSAAETSLPTPSAQDPLSSRTENFIPIPSVKSSHFPESQTIVPPDSSSAHSDVSFRTQGTWPVTRRYRVDNPFVPVPGAVSSLRYHRDEVRRENERQEYIDEEHDNREQDLSRSIGSAKLGMIIETFRSSSSSYPSEGIRSPPNQGSPEPTATTNAFIADLVRCNSVPTRMMLSRSDISENRLPSPDLELGHDQTDELVAVSGISNTTGSRIESAGPSTSRALMETTSSETSGVIGTPRIPFGSWPNKGHGQGIKCLKTFLEQECQDYDMNPRDSFSQSRFPASYLPVLAETSFSDNNDAPPQSSNPDGATSSRRENTFDTIYTSSMRSIPTPNVGRNNSLEMPILQRVYRAPSPARNPSSITLAQRMQKFRIKKWVRKVYKRSKVRFQHGSNVKTTTTPSSVAGNHYSNDVRALNNDKNNRKKNKYQKRAAGVDNKTRKNSLGPPFWARNKWLKKGSSSQDISRRVARCVDAVMAKKTSLMSMRPSRGREKDVPFRDGHRVAQRRSASWPA